ncbi:MAG: elongation factor P hydroxylase [Pontibacterium sp.]
MTVSQLSPSLEHKVTDLITVFNRLFMPALNTELVKGDDEPIYLPASDDYPHHRIIFAHGFFSSALHEISHWCVAGAKRRTLEDFGYWYKPDGRTEEEQALFEKVEIKPQALEWILHQACGLKFHFSADNLDAGLGASAQFKHNVLQQVCTYLEDGVDSLPARHQSLVRALAEQYGQPLPLAKDFSLNGK